MPFHLTGTLVKLRPLTSADVDVIIPVYQDFDLQLTTDGDSPPLTDVQVRAFWEEIISEPGPTLRYFGIEPLPGQIGESTLVGACSLQQIDPRNRHAELSIFMLNTAVRGQGYGTEATRLLLNYAFEVIRLDKVYLGVYEFNEAGLRAYEKAGFRYEGRLKQMLYYEGRYHDEWSMRMLRSEWERIKRAPADGLRPYHPADLGAALALIQREHGLSDAQTARGLLRRWWRQIDRELYCYQLSGKVVGLAVIDLENGTPYEMIADPAHQLLLTSLLEER